MAYTKQQRRRIWLKILASVAMFAVVFSYLNLVFRPKYTVNSTGKGASPTTTMHKGFYALPKNAIDVLFVGTSETYTGVNPLLIWKEAGIRSHVFGAPTQRMFIQQFFLREAFKRQSPSHVFFDVSRFFAKDDVGAYMFWINIGDIPPSFDKLRLILRQAARGKGYGLSFVVPLPKYHDRWDGGLTAEDFQIPLKWDNRDYLHGHSPLYITRPVELKYNAPEKDVRMPKENIGLFKEMKAMCEEKGAQMVLFKPPTGDNWNRDRSAYLTNFAQEHGVPFYDFFLNMEEIGLELNGDYQRSMHLNYSGSAKFTKFMIPILTDELHIKGSVDEKEAEQWADDYSKYQRQVKGYELTLCKDLPSFLAAAQDENYTLFFAACGAAGLGMDDAAKELLKETGLRHEFGKTEAEQGAAYLAVVENGKLQFERQDKTAPLTYAEDHGSRRVVIKSAGVKSGGGISMAVGSELHTERLNQVGLHIFVYDKVLEQVVDHVRYYAPENRLYR